MATPLARVSQKLFGSTGPVGDFGIFGSKANGTPTFSQDPTAIQSLPEFGVGWGSAVIGNYDPPLEDMNGLFLLLTRQLAYIFEKGIPEYDPSINYFIGSLIQVGGQIYNSVSNSNIGNNPTTDNGTNWQVGIGGINGGVPVATILAFAGPSTSVPTGFLLCSGQAVSRITYVNLFNVIGVTYGAGNGTTTFNVPNGQGQFLIGQLPLDANFGTVGVAGGSVTISMNQLPPHTHPLWNTPNTFGTGSLNGVAATNTGSTNGTTQSTGSGQPFIPPYLVVGGQIIKY